MNIYFDVGVKNLSYIIYTRTHEIIEWDVVDTDVRRKQGLTNIVRKLVDYLKNLCETKLNRYSTQIVYNVIENQPTMNPMMRVVSGIIGTFFYTKYSWKPVYYNPCHKLANVDISQAFESAGVTDVNPQDLHKKRRGFKKNIQARKEFSNAYRMRKRASIYETRRVLQENATKYQRWLTFFETHKRKQDDLADTFLMARAFIGSGMSAVETLDDPDVDSSESSDTESDGDESSDSSDEPDINETSSTSNVSSCVYREITRANNPTKSKVLSDDYPHYKFCLEECLHKEYGKGVSLNETLNSLVNKSQRKGIKLFRERLRTMSCTCDGSCGGVNSIFSWMFYEDHWKIMFK